MLTAILPCRGMQYRSLAIAAGCLLTASAAAQAATYDTLLSIGDVRSASNFNYASTHVFDGTTGYFIMRDVETSHTATYDTEISKVTDVGGAEVQTTLVNAAQWLSYTGSDLILPGAHAKVIGDSLQLIDQSTDSVYRVNTTTGAMSTVVSPTDILTLTGLTELQVREECTFDSQGNMYFYEDKSDQILTVDTAGVLSVFIDKATLQTAVGDASLLSYVSGAIAFDWDGNFYWTLSGASSAPGDVSRGSIYKMNAEDSTFSKALTQPEIVTVSKTDPFFGANYAAFNDMVLGPDGWFYTFERGNSSVLRFDPEDPSATIELLFSQPDLEAGDMGVKYINDFATFGDLLTWTRLSPSEGGIYYYETPGLQGDLNGDGFVGLDDLDIVLTNWNQNVTPDSEPDPSGDGFVGLDDLDIVLNNWNKGTPPTVSVVPEPATLALAGFAALALLGRKR